MTCGDAYRKCIDLREQGVKAKEIADEIGVSTNYLYTIYAKYDALGEKIFESKRPFKGTGAYKVPADVDIQANHYRAEYSGQEMARKMAELKMRVKVGDIVKYTTFEGVGANMQEVPRIMTVQYKGRDYLMGRGDKGYNITARLYDLCASGIHEMEPGVWETDKYLMVLAMIRSEKW